MKHLYALVVLSLSLFSQGNFSLNIISNSVIIGSSSGGSASGSDQVVTQHIKREPFRRIRVEMPVKLRVIQSTQSDIELRAPSHLVSKIALNVKGETLVIHPKESFSTQRAITITIANPHLEGLMVDGVGEINIEGYHEDEMSVEVSGVANVLFRSGRIHKLSLKAEGSYEVQFLGVSIDDATIIAEGTGDVTVDSARRLTVDLKGTVEVKYGGDPIIKKQVNDLANLTHI